MMGRQEEAQVRAHSLTHTLTRPVSSGMHNCGDPGFPIPHLRLSEQHSSWLFPQDLLPSRPMGLLRSSLGAQGSSHALSIVIGGRCVVMVTFQACHKLPREKTKPHRCRQTGMLVELFHKVQVGPGFCA